MTPTFEIAPVGDYSLEESARFVDGWHESPSEGGKTLGHLHLAFLTDDDFGPAGVCLTQDATGPVRGTVYGAAGADVVSKQVSRILSLDVDGRGWPAVGERDPVVGKVQRMHPGFRPVNWSNAYDAAAWCLISARISIRQGQAVKERMCRELGEPVDVHGHRLFCFPGPAAIVQLREFKGVFARKVEYLNALAVAALRGDLDTETLRAMPREAALEALERLPGIGEFASNLVRLRALSAVDELPAREPRLADAVRAAYGLGALPDLEQLSAIAEGWRPYRMWAAVCFRRSMAGGAGMMHSRAAG